MLTPNSNECNSTLTSGTKDIYPYLYIDVNDRGHRLRSGPPVTNFPSSKPSKYVNFCTLLRLSLR